MNRIDLWRLRAVLMDRPVFMAVLASPGGGWFVVRPPRGAVPCAR